jgi:hypothetical protein
VLVGGEISALLLGFAVITAIGLRRGLANERRRLFARGARRWQVAVSTAAELGALSISGALLGTVFGAAIVVVIAHEAGLAPLLILKHSLMSVEALAMLAGAWAAATFCLLAATVTTGEERRRRFGLGLLDVAALGAAGMVALSVSRGALDPQGVSSSATLLVLLPALISFIAAVGTARVLAPAMRLAERLSRQRSLSLRLAVLALARAPARTIVSCAFIAVAVGLALFAASYRATLAGGATDQAAFDVPLDYLLTEGSRLVRPLDAAPLARYRAIAREGDAYPVLRPEATAPGAGVNVFSPTLIGIPTQALVRLHWRSDFSAVPPRILARRLSPMGEVSPSMARVPAGRITLAVRLRGAGLAISAIAGDERGRIRFISLGEVQQGAHLLSARISESLTLRGLRISLTPGEQFFFAHRETEGDVASPPSGVLTLGELRANDRAIVDWRRWSFSGGPALRSSRSTQLRFSFAETGAGLIFRPVQPTDGQPIPVAVSPEIARATGGIDAEVPLSLQDVHLRARVVAVLNRMPTVAAGSGPFVIADRSWLQAAINADAPGRGTPNEIWISGDGPHAAAALKRPPFNSLVIASRSEIEARLAGDPLARTTARVLGVAALVALALALVGFWVGLLSEIRDERSDFFDLEAQGIGPRGLRAQLRTRGAILLGIGISAGVVLGAVLARLVIAFVRVSATNSIPDPPLRLEPALSVCLGGVAALAAAALILTEMTSRAVFRRSRQERASWSLE